jgi:hypothetical protein
MGVVGWRMPKNATAGAIPADNEWERLARHYCPGGSARRVPDLRRARRGSGLVAGPTTPAPEGVGKAAPEQVRKRQNLTDVNPLKQFFVIQPIFDII